MMRKTLFLLATTAILFSCGNNQPSFNKSNEMNEYEMAEDVAVSRQAGIAESSANIESTFIQDKKIIKDAQIGIKVEDYKSFRTDLDSVINKLQGYISNDNLDKNDQNINSNINIRIPEKNFDPFISYLEKGSGKLLYKNISARDVTEEFIDVEARLKTKKEVENRYIQLLSKAKNVKEILEIEEKLGNIREEIESKEGRLKYLNSQVAFSTIYLNVIQEFEYKYSPEKEKSFFQRLFKSLDKGWKGFIVFILFLFRIWPVILIGLAIFFYIRRIRIKRKQSKKQ